MYNITFIYYKLYFHSIRTSLAVFMNIDILHCKFCQTSYRYDAGPSKQASIN